MRVPTDRSLESWIRELIRDGKLYKFYKTPEFQQLRREVLEDYHNECKRCRGRGRYTRAKVVHHVNEVRDRPDLALTRYIIKPDGTKVENLIPLCQMCHEEVHGRAWRGRNEEARAKKEEEAEAFAPERW